MGSADVPLKKHLRLHVKSTLGKTGHTQGQPRTAFHNKSIETSRNFQCHSLWEAMWWVFNFDHVKFHQFHLKRLEWLSKVITWYMFPLCILRSQKSEIKSWKPCLLCKVIHQRLKSCLFLGPKVPVFHIGHRTWISCIPRPIAPSRPLSPLGWESGPTCKNFDPSNCESWSFMLKCFKLLPVRGRSVLANNPFKTFRSQCHQLIIDPTFQALGLKCTRPAVNKIWLWNSENVKNIWQKWKNTNVMCYHDSVW